MTTGVIAPPLPPLSPRQELAILARLLHRGGYDDHLAGHITYRQPDGTFYVNPFGLTWDELRASDVMHMDADGNAIDGPWTITPAVTLHVELHRARHDVGVALHNHPRWGTVWADLGRVPAIYDQSSAMYSGDIALVDDYTGTVDAEENAAAAVGAMQTADIALLANHGVMVLAPDIPMAYMRAATLEWRCRQAWHVEAVGGGRLMPEGPAKTFGDYFTDHAFPGMWEAVVRRQLRLDPTVLD